MIPAVNFSSFRQAHWTQFAMRFILGGAVTAGTGLIAQHWGPGIGGLFLAFPAIFPASATLIERHERQRKQRAGIACTNRGRKAAALDAAGAVFGGFGLICFGAVAWWLLPERGPLVALALSGLAWLLVAVSLWWLRQHA